MILCCGEALIDMLPRKTAVGGPAFEPFVGGSVFNTAIALGRLDVPTGFFSGLSNDMFGTMLSDALSQSGVDTACAVRDERPTTLAFVELRDGHAQYLFYDENSAGRMLGPNDLPELGDGTEALFFGGISLMAEPCGSTYEALMSRASADRVTMIDPNIRPGFIQDEATYRARIGRMIAMADIVKLSDEDLHWLEGPGDTDTIAADILRRGPRLVCVTAGAKGATGYTEGFTATAPAQEVIVADTVGAGDTYNAGLLAGLHQRGVLTHEGLAAMREGDLQAALDLGALVAAITVSREGANPPRLSEL